MAMQNPAVALVIAPRHTGADGKLAGRAGRLIPPARSCRSLHAAVKLFRSGTITRQENQFHRM
jgi:hypothetical protein